VVQPPAAPGSPSPASGATGVGATPTLTWSASGATTYDVSFGTTNPPLSVTTGQTAPLYTPPALAPGATYFWRVLAHNDGGTTAGPVWSFSTASAAASDIVVYAGDISPGAVHGAWTFAASATSPDGTKLTTAPTAQSNTAGPLASPLDFVDVTFAASAGTPYTFWIRLEALNN